MSHTYLSIQGISKTFGKFSALEPITIDIHKNEFVCLLGPSGCGKTTLLRIIAGLEQPEDGRITVGGKDITSLPPSKRNFGMMFQSYALFPNLTAAQNIAYGLKEKKMTKSDIKDKVKEVLQMVDLETVADKYPTQLSGGQQQRIALARAVALSPDFLLLDEPLSALDAKVRQKLRKEIRRLHEQLGMTTVMVTHDQEEALTMADKIVVMNNAKVVQVGTPEEVYDQPNSPFVADFIGAVNFISGSEIQKLTSSTETALAIRPEHIQIVEHPNKNSIRGIVTDIEFRGAFYRITLKPSLYTNSSLTVDELTLDLLAPVLKQLKLERGKAIYFDLPDQHLISFEGATPVLSEAIL
ncbi:putative 2-aminoethylphosphonate ABC transporter ATP-binding protein [Paenibacillus segetis]|uniref:2-aminoethylphosphonate ABC transporter ATP-binding protein n=1 Tax=Paenibacillus segetis TaxID=1325360 RepID=A0ABQ1YG19_9BACL|nr:putative 2-aminoethylphosphonate ABC transporter ATP-binding protein [Paenibacillus segetis]GGH23074.1 2-aminoethylphosphonate ABC transporter ATP-binding protein [Paenibacillus segetis]